MDKGCVHKYKGTPKLESAEAPHHCGWGVAVP